MSDTKWTPGEWTAYNMVHSETGEQMTPDEIGEYVANAARLGSPKRFLFVSADTKDGDICHVGNGPDGPFNARLIASAPKIYRYAERVMALLEEHGGDIVPHLLDTDENAGQGLRDALAEARGES